jgi:iron complex transport system substrate-binding protein
MRQLMKPRWWALPLQWIVVSVAMTWCAGCDQNQNQDESVDAANAGRTIEFVDDLGREVAMPAKPERIACGTSFAAELLVHLGHPPLLRPAVAPGEEVPESLRAVDELAIEHGVGPNMEQLAAAKPDLMILHTQYAQFVDNIEQTLGVPVIAWEITSFDDVPDKIETLASWVGAKDRGDELVRELLATREAFQQKLPERPPSVLALFGTSEGFYTFLPSSFLGDLVGLLGGELVTKKAESIRGSRSLAPFDLEHALATDPDVILIVRHGDPSNRIAELGSNPAWPEIQAVRDERVHVLSPHRYLTNPGPRLSESLAELKSLLYPSEVSSPVAGPAS